MVIIICEQFKNLVINLLILSNQQPALTSDVQDLAFRKIGSPIKFRDCKTGSNPLFGGEEKKRRPYNTTGPAVNFAYFAKHYSRYACI